jgi:hypothetical protein
MSYFFHTRRSEDVSGNFQPLIDKPNSIEFIGNMRDVIHVKKEEAESK